MAANLLRLPPFATRPGPRRLRTVIFLSLAAIILTMVVYWLTPPIILGEEARLAISKMEAGLLELKVMRRSLGIPMDTALDPAESGLIGVEYSDLTTSLGDLRAKQTSLNPQFAGLLVFWLKQAGVGEGDSVALCLSGSFPGLNLAAHCACDALKLKPVIISSIGASTYGANIPGFTWLDMEGRLFQRDLIRSRTQYASLGGIMDTGGGLDETGIKTGEEAIWHHGAIYLREGSSRDVIPDVERRMTLYTTNGWPKAFINVGGNVTSLGWVSEASRLGNGLLGQIPATSSPQRGTIFRMYEAGVPVVHLLNLERLAARYHLPIGPIGLTPDDPGLHMDSARWKHLWQMGILLGAWFGLGVLMVVYEHSPRSKQDENEHSPADAWK